MSGLLINLAVGVGLSLIVYAALLRPRILRWGADKRECTAPMPGDQRAPRISATRAITIDVPISEAWRWIIQLGADRCGFFSYDLLERFMGYRSRHAQGEPTDSDMTVGRVIPAVEGSPPRGMNFQFPVVEVDEGRSFVLENWGTFLLQESKPGRTRLIVRTHSGKIRGHWSLLFEGLIEVGHYIMERRMLIGLKAQAEAGAGVRLSATADNLWLLGVFLSGLLLIPLALNDNVLWGGLISAGAAVMWLCLLLLPPPRPTFSLTYTILLAAAAWWQGSG